jgi:hypothetical protein
VASFPFETALVRQVRTASRHSREGCPFTATVIRRRIRPRIKRPVPTVPSIKPTSFPFRTGPRYCPVGDRIAFAVRVCSLTKVRSPRTGQRPRTALCRKYRGRVGLRKDTKVSHLTYDPCGRAAGEVKARQVVDPRESASDQARH